MKFLWIDVSNLRFVNMVLLRKVRQIIFNLNVQIDSDPNHKFLLFMSYVNVSFEDSS